MSKNIRKCPYCGEEVSYIQALSEINLGEHTCPGCNKNSNISYSKKIYIPTAIVLVFAVAAAFLLFKLNVIKNIILACVIVLIPFAVFYFLTPLYFNLESIGREAARTPVARKRKPANQKKKKEKKENSKVFKEEKEIFGSQGELNSMEKNSSFKDRFSKFVKTYIIVDDDEEEKQKNENDYFTNDEADTGSSKQEQYDSGSWSMMSGYGTDENSAVASDEDFVADFDTDSEEHDVVIEDISSGRPTAAEPEDIFSSSSLFEEEDKKEPDFKQPEPVYHKMTKTTEVDHLYFPEKADTVHVDIFTQDEPAKAEEEPAQEPDDSDDEDIMMFFNSTPSEEEEKEFGRPAVQEEEVSPEKEQTEEPIEEPAQEPQPEPEEEVKKDNDLFEYRPEGSALYVDLDEDQTSEETEEELEETELPEEENEEETVEEGPEEEVIEDTEDETEDEEAAEVSSEAADETEEITDEPESENSEDTVVAPELASDDTDDEEEYLSDLRLAEEQIAKDLDRMMSFGDTSKQEEPSDEAAPEEDNEDEESGAEENEPEQEEFSSEEEISEVSEDTDDIEDIEDFEDTDETSALDESSEDNDEIEVPDEIESSFTLVNEEEEQDEQDEEESDVSENEIDDEDEADEDTSEDTVSDTETEDNEEPVKQDEQEDDESDVPEDEFDDEEEDEEDEEYDELFSVDDEEDEDDDLFDSPEGAVEYLPSKGAKPSLKKEPAKEEGFVVDYSGEENEKSFQEELDLSEYRTSNYSEEDKEQESKPEKKLSRYEKKFPNAVKAAAAEAAENERIRKAEAAERKRRELEEQERLAAEKDNGAQKENNGFFAKLKSRIIAATESERDELFEQEERERRIADKEARRKAREKEKNAQKGKKKDDPAEVTRSERKKSAGDAPDKSHTRVFEPVKPEDSYAAAEKEIFDRVKAEMESEPQRKLTSQDKVRIIAERADEEKRKAESDKIQLELERRKAQSERDKLENKRKKNNSQKAEQIRREQMEKARKNQDELNEGGDRQGSKRSLKDTGAVRSSVSQKKKKRKQQANDYFGES